MTEKLVKSGVTGVVFALISSVFISLILTLLLYFELIGVGLASKILYGAFVVILFAMSFIIARIVGSKGLFIGLGIAGAVILFGALYRFIGIETGIGITFGIRSAVTALVSIVGAVMGVNTVK